MLDLSLEAVRVSRSPRYMTDLPVVLFVDGSRKLLIGCAGINSTIRDPVPGIQRSRLDAKEHAEGTRCVAKLQQVEQGRPRRGQCHLRL